MVLLCHFFSVDRMPRRAPVISLGFLSHLEQRVLLFGYAEQEPSGKRFSARPSFHNCIRNARTYPLLTEPSALGRLTHWVIQHIQWHAALTPHSHMPWQSITWKKPRLKITWGPLDIRTKNILQENSGKTGYIWEKYRGEWRKGC